MLTVVCGMIHVQHSHLMSLILTYVDMQANILFPYKGQNDF